MCTAGPCEMTIEKFSCGNSAYLAEVYSEGRDHCIVLYSPTTAGTHVMLREVVKGVVLCNGTMGGRVSQAHSLATSVIEANLNKSKFGGVPLSRSTKSIEILCRTMTRLMALSPPASLFSCSACISSENHHRLHALCIDGVGKDTTRSQGQVFVNIRSMPSASHLESFHSSRLNAPTGALNSSRADHNNFAVCHCRETDHHHEGFNEGCSWCC